MCTKPKKITTWISRRTIETGRVELQGMGKVQKKSLNLDKKKSRLAMTLQQQWEEGVKKKKKWGVEEPNDYCTPQVQWWGTSRNTCRGGCRDLSPSPSPLLLRRGWDLNLSSAFHPLCAREKWKVFRTKVKGKKEPSGKRVGLPGCRSGFGKEKLVVETLSHEIVKVWGGVWKERVKLGLVKKCVY